MIIPALPLNAFHDDPYPKTVVYRIKDRAIYNGD